MDTEDYLQLTEKKELGQGFYEEFEQNLDGTVTSGSELY
jgi:hypothetical protein